MRVLKEKYNAPDFIRKRMIKEFGQEKYIQFNKQEIKILKKAELILRAATNVYDENEDIEPDQMIQMAWSGLHQVIGDDDET